MKPKNSTTIPAKDLCQTPAYALDPILPYLRREWLIWEPACGKCNLVYALQNDGFCVNGTDILEGLNFFYAHPPLSKYAIVTNPPFSLKYKWLARCYELDVPFALLMPVDVLGAASAQRLFKAHGLEVMLLDKRVNFEMPNMGYDGHGAQFSTAWFCHKLLPSPVMYGEIVRHP